MRKGVSTTWLEWNQHQSKFICSWDSQHQRLQRMSTKQHAYLFSSNICLARINDKRKVGRLSCETIIIMQCKLENVLGRDWNKRKGRNHLLNRRMRLINYYAMNSWHVLGFDLFSKTKLGMFLGRIDNKRKGRDHFFNCHVKLYIFMQRKLEGPIFKNQMVASIHEGQLNTRQDVT